MESFFDNLPWMETASTNRIFASISDGIKYDTRLWLITGQQGAGKSRLLKELVKELSVLDGLWVGQCDAKQTDGLSAVAKALGENDLPVSLSIEERLTLMLKQRHALGQKVVLLIDNAKSLSEELLLALCKAGELNVAEKKYRYRFNLILASESFESDALNLPDLNIQTFNLLPMTAPQVKSFAQYALQFLGEKIILTPEQVLSLHSASLGYPGRVISHLSSVRSPVPTDKKWVTSKQMGAYGLAVVGVMTVGYLIFYRMMEDEGHLNADLNIVIGGSTDEVLVNNNASETEPITDDLFFHEPTESDISMIPEPSIVHEIDKSKSQLISSATNPVVVPSLPTAEKIGDTAVVTGQPQVTNSATLMGPMEPILPKGIVLGATDNSANAESVVVEVVATMPAFYIIQLTNGQSQQEAKQRLQGKNIPGRPQFAQMMINGKKRWISYIGPYQQKEQAEQGLKVLPASLQSLQPRIYSEHDLLSE